MATPPYLLSGNDRSTDPTLRFALVCSCLSARKYQTANIPCKIPSSLTLGPPVQRARTPCAASGCTKIQNCCSCSLAHVSRPICTDERRFSRPRTTFPPDKDPHSADPYPGDTRQQFKLRPGGGAGVSDRPLAARRSSTRGPRVGSGRAARYRYRVRSGVPGRQLEVVRSTEW